ncbi:hypothetical protein MMB17_02125 [Methylobacterium organophilum]|uniref:hypothetical protein n=1 Tax=Methylobacterium organophilum TaxID=410 RepID=UPI001F12AE90|nr:hypothetical protein [Methylobacterium organophilum]UMY20290.1 hypothetical protein MMB17_02125 [Methylobacterium organophilum]
MPSRILFTSELHVGHRALLFEWMSTRRQFASIEEHDETLVANWNATLRPEDTVWWVRVRLVLHE